VVETSQSAFDQYSLGHVAMGAIILLLLILIVGHFGKKRDPFMALAMFIVTIIISIGWELFENTPLIISTGLKYNNMRDSNLNMFTDIALNILGAGFVFVIFWFVFRRTNVKQELVMIKKKIV
jgi:chromate transport protein ChrA